MNRTRIGSKESEVFSWSFDRVVRTTVCPWVVRWGERMRERGVGWGESGGLIYRGGR